MSDPAQSSRYHSLDALRAFALLLGIVFHAAESFCPERYSWAILDRYPHWFFEIFQHICHSFRMEVFFLMAGFFAHLVYHRRGRQAFVMNRLGRILVPFLIGWILLYPTLAFLWITGAMDSGRLDTLGLPPEVHHLPAWQLTLGGLVTLQLFKVKFSLTHLWFLYQLMIVYLIVLVGREAVVVRIDRNQRLRASLDDAFRWMLASRIKVVWFMLPTLPCLWFMGGLSVDTPDDSLIPNSPVTLIYCWFFLTGWMLHRQPRCLVELGRGWPGYLLIGLGFSGVTLLYSPAFNSMASADSFVGWVKLSYHLAYGLMMWAFVFGISGLFLQFFNNHHPVWRYVADSSYWLFIVHLPVIISLQIWLAPVDMSPWIKYLLINAIAFLLLFLSYHYFVRSTFIGAQLNGRKVPRGRIPE